MNKSGHVFALGDLGEGVELFGAEGSGQYRSEAVRWRMEEDKNEAHVRGVSVS